MFAVPPLSILPPLYIVSHKYAAPSQNGASYPGASKTLIVVPVIKVAIERIILIRNGVCITLFACISLINSGDFPLKDEPGYDVIFDDVNGKKFRATTNFNEAVNSSDVIILSLPTPMDEKNINTISNPTETGKI